MEKSKDYQSSKIELKISTDNMQKYYNYRDQMKRLNKAMKQNFYLEAIFIEYSIMEDRFESILRHAGEWEKMYQKAQKQKRHVSIDAKIKKISNLASKKKSLEEKYFSNELLESAKSWKNERNPLTHSLLKLDLQTEDLKQIAIKGQSIVKTLRNKTTAYRRAMEKQKQE